MVYDELHRPARRYIRGERRGHGLQTTALVNEVVVSPATLMRDWSTAKAWLYRDLAGWTRDGR
jgi:hypothetical protein